VRKNWNIKHFVAKICYRAFYVEAGRPTMVGRPRLLIRYCSMLKHCPI